MISKEFSEFGSVSRVFMDSEFKIFGELFVEFFVIFNIFSDVLEQFNTFFNNILFDNFKDFILL